MSATHRLDPVKPPLKQGGHLKRGRIAPAPEAEIAGTETFRRCNFRQHLSGRIERHDFFSGRLSAYVISFS
jgi:hypothetical protein